MKNIFFFLLFMPILLLSNEATYKKALNYLNGEIGARKVIKNMPRCPYERCDNKKTYVHTDRDLKSGYKLLKEASNEDDVFSFMASYKAATILLRQIDYKSKEYDELLTSLLLKNYGISENQYNKDVIFFLEKLSKSNQSKYKCYGTFNLFDIYKNGYLKQNKDIQSSKIFQNIGLLSCPKTSFQYLILSKDFT